MEKETTKTKSKKIAVVRVRGLVNLNQEIKKTFELINLHNKNWCVVLTDSETDMGMIKKVKDYVTWGELEETVLKDLFEKRGEEFLETQLNDHKKYVEYNKKKYKRYFRLSPPVKGFGRKGVKVPFKQGGALGNRGEKINDLLRRMI